MQLQEFLTEVQKKTQLSTPQKAELATKATLQTLGERLAGGAAENFGSQLPQKVCEHLGAGGSRGERFSIDEFFQKVAQKERTNVAEATHHARGVMEVVVGAVDPKDIDKVLTQLPDDFHPLFGGGSAHDQTAAGTA